MPVIRSDAQNIYLARTNLRWSPSGHLLLSQIFRRGAAL